MRACLSKKLSHHSNLYPWSHFDPVSYGQSLCRWPGDVPRPSWPWLLLGHGQARPGTIRGHRMTILLQPPQTRRIKIMLHLHVGETTKAHGWKNPNRGTPSGVCVTTSASTLWRRSAARSTGIPGPFPARGPDRRTVTNRAGAGLPVAHQGQDGRATVITQTPHSGEFRKKKSV
jgi:hypothetical protein